MQSSTRFRQVAIFVFLPLLLGIIVWRVLRPMALQYQLQSAIKRKDLIAAKQLVAQGANPTPSDMEITDLRLVLMSVKRDDNASLAFFLEHGAATDGACIESPLMIAVRHTNLEAIKMLLAHGVNVRADEGAHGFVLSEFPTYFLTSPHNAAEREKQRIIVQMIKNAAAKTPTQQ